MNRLLALFLVTAIDTIGFGIVIPLLPYLGDRFGASPTTITWILMAYAVFQLIASPLWGRLSDRLGRRPVLIIGLAGACVSYLMLGFARDIWWLLASRVLGGIMAGNIAAALAYAADVSTVQDRAKALGTVGAAIGIGFMVGPAIGGLLAGNDVASASFMRPALASACLSIVGIGLVLFVLPESRTAEQRRAGSTAAARLSPVELLRRLPRLRTVTTAALAVTTAQATLESIAALWALKRFGFGPATAGLMLFTLALVAVVFQGGLVRVLVRRFGELKLARAGAALYAAGPLVIAVAPDFGSSVIGLVLCGAALGLWQPSGSALASRQATPDNRGAVMGTYQASGSVARILGPAVSGPLFSVYGPSAPFVFAAAMGLLALVLLRRLRAEASA
jgi:MFS family permease